MHHKHERRPAALLFDLDDTLSDHLACARAGLVEQQQRHPEVLGGETIATLETIYSTTLEATHSRMLAGEISNDQARTIRTREFFAHFGHQISDADAHADYLAFRAGYDKAHGVVAGTHELLTALADEAFRMGVITNNLEAEQHAKLRRLDLFDYFEMLAISEEVGVPKPDPHIFEVALDRMQLDVDQVVMVGDSLTSDIAGALGVGMPCVWLDRHRKGAHAAPAGVQAVIAGDFGDLDASLDAIVGAFSR